MRTTFDFTPYRRSTVGFDRLFDQLEASARSDIGDGFPPYDLERVGDDSYRITLAVAGFNREEIEIIAQDNQLLLTGRKEEERQGDRYLHRGIAVRSFERRFQLADFVAVESATMENGLLSVELKRQVPEAMKPRRIEIGNSANDSALPPRLNNRDEAA